MTGRKTWSKAAVNSLDDLRALLERTDHGRTSVNDERNIARILMSTEPKVIEFEAQPPDTLWCMAFMIKTFAQLQLPGSQLVSFLNLEAAFLQRKASMDPSTYQNLMETGSLCSNDGLFKEPVLNAFFERHFGDDCLKSVPLTGWKVRGARKSYVCNSDDREAVNEAFEEADALMAHYDGGCGHWATPVLRTTLVELFPDRDDDSIIFNMDASQGANAPRFAKPGVKNPPSVYDTPGLFGSDSPVYPTRILYAVLDLAKLNSVDKMLSLMSTEQYALRLAHICTPPPLPSPPLPDSPRPFPHLQVRNNVRDRPSRLPEAQGESGPNGGLRASNLTELQRVATSGEQSRQIG
jgi:hypothetical protein